MSDPRPNCTTHHICDCNQLRLLKAEKENQLLKERLEDAENVIKFTASLVTWVKETDQKIIYTYGNCVERARAYLEKYKGEK